MQLVGFNVKMCILGHKLVLESDSYVYLICISYIEVIIFVEQG